jgi:hypothetical protein
VNDSDDEHRADRRPEDWSPQEKLRAGLSVREAARALGVSVGVGTTRRVPREVFEAEERAHLGPAPAGPFDVPRWTRAKVHPDHHVQVAYVLYSVPTRYLGADLPASRRQTLSIPAHGAGRGVSVAR